MFIKRFKNVISTSLPVDPESIIAYHDPPFVDPPLSDSLPIDSQLFTVETETFTLSDLDLPITHQKCEQSCT